MECPKCEREIKADEKNCPYCKYDLVNRPKIQKEESELYSNYKKWIVGGIIVFVAIIIIGSITWIIRLIWLKTERNTL